MHEADGLALVPGAEPVPVSFAAAEGELRARLAPPVVEPLVEPAYARTVVLLHVAHVLIKHGNKNFEMTKQDNNNNSFKKKTINNNNNNFEETISNNDDRKL